MDSFGGLGFSDVSSAARKKRSNTSRRPRNESQLPLDYRDISSLSSTPPSDDNMLKSEGGGYVESDEASNNGSFRGSNEHRHSGIDSKRSSKGALAPANWKGPSKDWPRGVVSDGLENKSTVKKVKLKVGGVKRTIQAKSASDGASAVGLTSTKSSHISDAPRPRKKLILQENSDDNDSFSSDKVSGLRGVTWKDSSKSVLDIGKADTSKSRMPEEPIRKSKRIPKRRFLDEAGDAGDDDVEVQYLEKLKSPKVTSDYSLEDQEDEERAIKKERKISSVGQYSAELGDYGISRSGKEGKKSRPGRVFDDTDYVIEDEPVSDGEFNTKRKKPRREFFESSSDNKEMTVTTRQRALQTGTDVSSNLGATAIEFPNGLPPAPPRKQKEKICAVEQQLKKAEAAQRRRMQVEKAARESEAEAIRKILGQDSSRKKKEDKIKKRQEDLAQERAANAMLPSDSVRWVIGPSGSIVTFPDTMGLPTIFDPSLAEASAARAHNSAMARAPSKHGRDQALDFQGFLSDLQDWELSLKDNDKKMRPQDSNKEIPKTRDFGTSSYSRNYDPINAVSSSFTSEDSLPDAASEKELGNEYFKQKKFKEAIDCYARSIALSPTAVAYANRAMSYIKIKRFQEAEDDCTEALNLDDRYIKAYSRRATARKELGKLKESIEDAEFALRLEPHNQEIKKQYAEAKSLYEKRILQKASGALKNSEQEMHKLGKLDTKVNGHSIKPVSSSTQRTEKTAEDHTKRTNTSGKQASKVSVQELASRAASRAKVLAAENITPPTSAYQFEASWRGLSGDRALQAKLLKALSPSALPQIFKNALTVHILVDIIKCVTTFFIDDMDLAVNILENLTEVPRFGTLIMFLSSTDKADLAKIWDEVFYSEATPIEFAEKLDNLRTKYCLER